MKTMRTLMLLLAGVGGVAFGGCGADVPENPTWQDDVHPIMVARCIRCHNSEGTPDPLSPGAVIGNFEHDAFSDFGTVEQVITPKVGEQVAMGLMPPPPAAKLADWQIETLERWSKNPK